MPLRRLARLLPVLAVVVAAGALRWAVMESVLPVRPHGDEVYYLGTAMQIALGNGHVSADGRLRAAWAPGQSFWLSRFVEPSSIRAGDPMPRLRRLAQMDPERADPELVAFLRPLLRAQVLLGTALVLATLILGHQLFGARTGLLAATLVAVDPVLVAYSHYLWSETLFALLFVTALVAAVATASTQKRALAVSAGLLFGAAALTREIAVPLAVACGLWWLMTAEPGRRRRAFGLVLLLGLGGSAVVVPWTLRNAQVLPRWVPIASRGWATVREGNALSGWLSLDYREIRAFQERYFRLDEGAQIELARREALELVREEMPLLLAKKLVSTPTLLFEPSSKLYEKISLGGYGTVSLGLVRGLLVACTAFWAATLGFAVLGIAGAGRRDRRLLPVCVLGASLLLLVPSYAMTRYRVPLMPLLLVYAAHAMRSGRAVFAELRGGRAWGVAVALLVLYGLCLPYFAADAASLWTRGRIASGWWFS